ncbi:MAG: DUF2690 domain-containing protein [Stackebrandtia sp.]
MDSTASHIRRRLLRWETARRVVVVAAAALVLLALGFARPVEASWHGLDPAGTDCVADARTEDSAAITFGEHRLGTIELRYSPSCRTAWARLSNHMTHVPAAAHAGYAEIVRNSDGSTYTCDSPHGQNTVCWTKMVNDSGVTSYAYGNVDPYPTFGYGVAEARTQNY